MKLQLGTIQTLKVARKIDTGYVLSNGEKEVLLHISEAKEELEAEQEVEVFLYQDKKGQIVATMTIPTVRFDAFDWAEVVEVVSGLGVFVDIGIKKEILVSSDDLPLLSSVWPEVGDELYVALDKDKGDRLIAKPVKEGDFGDDWDQAPKTLLNAPISGRVFRTSKEGAVIITEEGYRGFIHHTERKRDLRLGEWVKGRVIEVKEDGTLNVSLRPLKQVGMIDDAQMIIDYLEAKDGVMAFTDKSDPEAIKKEFHISKAAFKRALGKLMKENKIEQKDGKTYQKK
ncbi:S1-like domain-containing RNA-binding protein [Aquibacillus koreensis]|uniref:S1-like domain-containing RNA-binding protein n=1 Tax=Aquibacillus koreensis TaxID=279446 RepID=A0A9X3WQ52_9BACI|nr:S1-like domain-containing RNA-binding protein [Aquibacillus koreensis]MCT2536325.1 S1-like domain-containing RNA-binding protein [Aquibacillus koreensis]MDC3421324.1 S1-like domain-containing RNA-binding protein [Aquibacillus koreensis]